MTVHIVYITDMVTENSSSEGVYNCLVYYWRIIVSWTFELDFLTTMQSLKTIFTSVWFWWPPLFVNFLSAQGDYGEYGIM